MTKLLIITIFLFTTLLYANYADTYGISSEEISRGNAVTATVNNWSSSYYNIAGLGKTKYIKNKNQTNELAISYMYTVPMLNLNIEKDTNALEDLNFGTITFGLVLDIRNFINLPDIISSARFGMIMGLMQDGTLVKINDLDIRSHSFLRYGRDIQRAVIFSGMGFGFNNDMFGIGFGANIWTGGKGKIEMSNLELNSGKQIPSSQTQLDLGPKIAPVAGFYFSISSFDLGFSYKHELYMDMPLETNAAMLLAGVEMELELYITDFYTPTSLTLGLAYTFSDLTLSVDIDYQLWSNFIKSKSAQNFVEIYNKDNGDKEDIVLPEMKDIIIPKIGISYAGIKDLRLNAGYYFRPTFLPDDAGETFYNFMDSDAHVVSLGLNYLIPKNSILVASMELNLTTQFQILSSKDVIKSNEFVSDLNPDYNFNGTVISVFAEILMRW